MRVKKYKPCKTFDDLVKRRQDHIAYINRATDWMVYVHCIPVEIFGLNLKGRSGSFSLEDLVKYL